MKPFRGQPGTMRATKRAATGLAAFLALWAAFGLVFALVGGGLSSLPDTDSYYHLAVAELYAEEGVVENLEWARFSVLHEGFGDKELLFHLVLVPFTAIFEGKDAGRWALAFWNALAVFVVGWLARRAGGRRAGGHRIDGSGAWAVLVPALLWLGSMDFLSRMVRLRPETPALVLLLLAAFCAGTGRERALGFVAFLFTLSYTAFHALLGLCGLWFLCLWWRHRAPRWRLLAYPVLGAGLALLVHPHFPHNLVVWKVQSVDFFLWKDLLDVGTEIGAQPTDRLLAQNLPWLVGLAAVAWAAWAARANWRGHATEGARPDGDERTSGDPHLGDLADVFTVAAGIFGVLYLLMMRFSTHALPFLTLALLFRLRVAGRLPLPPAFPGSRERRRAAQLAAAGLLVVALLAGAWRSGVLFHGLISVPERDAEWEALGEAIPDGARVAAPWGQTPIYLYVQPRARYLNVLDPVFLAVPHPELHRVQKAIFDGDEPDVPLAAASGLDSDHLAVSALLVEPRLVDRLRGDPRAEAAYADLSLLFRFAAAPDAGFVTDWKQVPVGETLPVSRDRDVAAWPDHPLVEEPELRAFEAYVDGRRSRDDRRCRAYVRDEVVQAPEKRRYELAPWGATTLWRNDEEIVSILHAQGAVLGRGVEFEIGLDAGPNRMTVLTCKEEREDGRNVGFYLRELN